MKFKKELRITDLFGDDSKNRDIKEESILIERLKKGVIEVKRTTVKKLDNGELKKNYQSQVVLGYKIKSNKNREDSLLIDNDFTYKEYQLHSGIVKKGYNYEVNSLNLT